MHNVMIILIALIQFSLPNIRNIYLVTSQAKLKGLACLRRTFSDICDTDVVREQVLVPEVVDILVIRHRHFTTFSASKNEISAAKMLHGTAPRARRSVCANSSKGKDTHDVLTQE